MSRNGQDRGPVAFPFPTTPGGPPGVEVTGLPGLLTRIGRLGVAADAPVRLEFHLLLAVRSGLLRCVVDTTDCAVPAGSWLWVRPGQFVRFPGQSGGGAADADTSVVLFQASFLDAATVAGAHLDRRAWRLPMSPAPEAARPLERTLEQLESEYHQLRDLPLEVHVALVRHLLAVLVLRLANLPGGQRRHAGDASFRRFRDAVEQDFTRDHQVEAYAARLGYSVRSLTRATNAAVGRGAKAFIDDRLVLEAKRLLLHTHLPASAIADRLGFSSTTVFTRFFRHRTTETPLGFRRRARTDTSHGAP
ncbi:AraC family transcriptional regulator [Streptomyces sp. NPDC021356]|uniref:helix-turn-helix domain-containing protein n=1 Tax=Streptomyces sp. NPDC021356 TaxID=3154900 RepID=UPI0033E35D25